MLSVNMFSGFILSLGLLLPGLGAFGDKTAQQDCCAKKLACCGKAKVVRCLCGIAHSCH